MGDSSKRSSALSDPQIEQMLRDFFRAEMPAALREEQPVPPRAGRPTSATATPDIHRHTTAAASPVRLRQTAATTAPPRGTTGVALIAACTLLLAVGALWWTPSGQSPGETSAARRGTVDSPAARPAAGVPEQPLPVAGDDETFRPTDTSGQPVERRGAPGGNPIEHVEDRGAATVESEFPELEIEVRPIEKQPQP